MIAWTVALPRSRSPRTTPTTIAGGAIATSSARREARRPRRC